MPKEYKLGKLKIFSRIILKFHDRVDMPSGDKRIIHKSFLDKNIKSWQKMFFKFKEISVSKLCTFFNRGKVEEMLAKAKIKYKLPKFENFFAIYIQDNIDKKEILDEVWKDKNIEYAYIESGITDPPTVNFLTNPSSKWQG